MTDPITFVLPLAGGALQFLVRQFKSVPEWGFYGIAVILACAVYWLVTPAWWAGDWRGTLLDFLSWMSVHLTSLLGGTFVASNGAKALVGNNPALAESKLVPLTNSK